MSMFHWGKQTLEGYVIICHHFSCRGMKNWSSVLGNKTRLFETCCNVRPHVHINIQHMLICNWKQMHIWSLKSKACLRKSCSSEWVAARGVLQVILLYVQKANNSKLNNVSLVTIAQSWLCVDSHHIANSLTAVTPTSPDWSLVASVWNTEQN